MKPKLLGLRLNCHDSNISLYDGEKIRYYKPERDRQKKHHAYDNWLEWKEDIKRVWNIDARELSGIALVLEEPITNKETFDFAECKEELNVSCEVWQINHHLAHTLSTRIIAPGNVHTDIVMDGQGDPDIVWSVFKKDKLIEEGSLERHGSIGGYMAEVGDFILGIKAFHGLDIAGKVMGIQSYGRFDEEFYRLLDGLDEYKVIDLFDFNRWVYYKQDPKVANLTALDWIKTVHSKTEEILIKMFLKHTNKNDVITFSGGVAQNIIWNTALKKQFKNLHLIPHSLDEGLSLGALEWLLRRNNIQRPVIKNFPFITEDEAPDALPTRATIKKAAQLLAQGKIIGWYQGHGEIGPRALGNRSILMNPAIEGAKIKVNSIKKRENYRPFGASILLDHKKKYFCESFDNPYMLYAYKLEQKGLEGITHIDNTCRCQTVEGGLFYDLIQEFYKLTGLPLVLNTSLNVAGRPLAGRIRDAKEVFYNTQLDALFCGNNYLVK